jgi:hypothetical protein
MVDRAGNDISNLIGARDDLSYRSDTGQVRDLTRQVAKDWIEAEVDLPPDAKKVFLTFRVRNTLLNTVLLYDVMLGSQGAGALNWIASMNNPLKAWKMDRWYRANFGLGIEVWNGHKFVEKARLGDCGPIAWKQVAVEVPLPKGPRARFRFTFLPDNWMVDWIGVSFHSRSDFLTTELSPCEVIDLHGRGENSGCEQLAKKDKNYLITYPGDAWLLNFQTGDPPEGLGRTCFLKSRGYYIEWIRPAWLANTAGKKRFIPGDENTQAAARLWLEKKSTLEKEFFDSRISWQGGSKP